MRKEQWSKMGLDIVAALAKVAKKHGVTFENPGIIYGENDCTFKIIATVNDASGDKLDLPRMEFIKRATDPAYSWSGVKQEWLDQSFIENGRTYTVIGYKTNSKYPFITRRDDKKILNWRGIAQFMKAA